MNLTISTVLVLFALAGIALSAHIFFSKRKQKPLVCPLNSDCNAVVYSDFSRLFGIPLEILGLIYYGLVVASYILFTYYPILKTPPMIFSLLLLTTVAFLFSIYLTLIQAFAIREWCVWCLISAGFCTVIFSLALIGNELSFIDMLIRYHDFITAGLTIGLTLGVGAATVYGVLYIKFLRDLKISQIEHDILRTIAQVIWIALITIIVSAISLYLSQPEAHNTSPSFLIKIIVLGVILVGDALLNIIVAPQLIDISFGKRHEHAPGELRNLRRLSFALVATSLVSWYALLTLLALPLTIATSFGLLTLYYLLALLIGLLISQIVDYLLKQ
jgi:uncharacterized membrane protein